MNARSGPSSPQHVPAGGGRVPPVLLLAGFLVWCAIALLLVLTEVQDSDLGFHIAMGRLLQGSFHTVGLDPLGQDPSVLRSAYGYWLYQVLTAFLYDRAGPGALVLLRAFLLLGSMIAAGWLARRQGASAVSILFGSAFCLVLCEERAFLDRPELLSYLLWVSAFWILWRHRAGRGVWALVPLQALWANVHLWYGLLPALVAAFAVGDRLQKQGSLGRMGRVLLALLAATCLNPRGPAVWASQLTLVRFLTDRTLLPFQIQEMVSPYARYNEIPAVWAFRIGMPIVLVLCVLARRRIGLGPLLALGLAAVLGAQARRGISLFGLTSAMLLPIGVDLALGRLSPSGVATARRALALVLLLAGGVGLWESATGRFFVRWEQDVRSGLGAHPRWPGRGAARFLRDHAVEGPIFHNGVFAGAVLLENGTRLTPFLDARWAGTPETMKAYQEVRGATAETIAQAWGTLDRSRAFEAVLLDFYEMPSLLRWLAQAPDWGIAYRDETAIVFCRRGGKNQRVLDDAEPSIQRGRAVRDPARAARLAAESLRALEGSAPPPFARVEFPYGPLLRGNLAVQMGWIDDAQASYLELLETERGALRFYPRRLGLWKNLLWSLEESDQPEAIVALAAKVGESPGIDPAQRALIRLRQARACDQLGREEEAMALAHAVAEDAAAGAYLRWTAWCRVANLHTEARAYPAAVEALRRAVELQPQSADTYRSLGLLLDRELARTPEALAAYDSYLALGGADPAIAERARALRNEGPHAPVEAIAPH